MVVGEAVASRTDAAEAPRGVDTAVDAEAARLSQRKQVALVHVWRHQEGAVGQKEVTERRRRLRGMDELTRADGVVPA